jgi:hypothetical protein
VRTPGASAGPGTLRGRTVSGRVTGGLLCAHSLALFRQLSAGLRAERTSGRVGRPLDVGSFLSG